jgi:hypothetical protein
LKEYNTHLRENFDTFFQSWFCNQRTNLLLDLKVIGGDEDGAKRTQEEFLRKGIIISQINSLAYAIEGRPDEARRVQEEFGKNLENMVDSVPVIGHLKGAIHVMAGDEERGQQIIEGNTFRYVQMNSNDCQTHKIYITARLVQKWYSDMR